MYFFPIRLALALAGLYVTLRFLQNVRHDRQCGENGYCTIVFRAPQGSTLGVKNTTVGLMYYSCLLVFTLLQMSTTLLPGYFTTIVAAIVMITAAGSVYLLIQLFVVLKMRCPLCFAAHCINFALVVSFLLKN